MQRFGFVFPGQGSQKLGMLAELATAHPEVEDTFKEASDALGIDLWQVAQLDSENNLDQTQITQPVLLSASVAIWRAWCAQQAPAPSIMAGHSLGEYSALVCAGVLEFADAVKLVHQRGLYMQAAVVPGAGKMAAIVGLENYQINEACEQAAQGQVVSAANYNSIGQTVIAGDVEAVERAMALCKEAGAKRALPLNVSVPSHCALMQPAAEQLQQSLNDVDFSSAKIPVVQNVNAQINSNAEEIKEYLIKQLYAPVLWVDSVRLMHKAGVQKLIECGPGKVLSGLIRRIEPEISCFGSDDVHGLETAIAEVTI
ncbi:MAG: ACP S-malonyltransferase [Gammaproteobacteria bacterium]|jgi:[acyl-carrier-protein] S-malonyltransferase|nr:ACP S-malonyltransferase [Gammaproteobacteria bacterium]MBT3858853.1 ACP S-malonyltransferase [Gammaproteobacteria bacterium]MBT3986204.1 ACP S-malonyltransferase [Gammaproteobacteria bacterium]MBT4255843.1 ACP S-malonyltransferase [Gammaproteobacteria bacterium]MBT4659128.1 ACP S-malonyltransferase [Gammaproteobacteria bacterium]